MYQPERNRLFLNALSKRGVRLNLTLHDVEPEGTLLERAKTVARSGLEKIESAYPGDEVPPRDEPPVQPCSLATIDELLIAWKGVWTPGPGDKIELSEDEEFSPSGGSWGCRADEEPNEAQTVWWEVKKGQPAAPRGAPLRGVGASAWWPSDIAGAPRGSVADCTDMRVVGCTLIVLTRGGTTFEVSIDTDLGDVDAKRKVVMAIAKTIAPRLSSPR